MAHRIPVLLYHGVDRVSPPGLRPWVMHPDRFASHLDVLVDRGCSTLTISALVDAIRRGDELPERTVAITFDDGLADFAAHAWPALRDRDLAATLYVVTGSVGGRAEWLSGLGGPCPDMLSWDQVRTLADEGCEIGAHSHSHPQLDTLPSHLLENEVTSSRDELSARLGRRVRSFAYPHGYHDRRVRNAVVRAGFDSACAVREALSSPDDDRFALARVTLLHDADTALLADVLDGRRHPVAPSGERLRTKGWRSYRRARRRMTRR